MELPPLDPSAGTCASAIASLSEETPADSTTDFDENSRPVPIILFTPPSEEDASRYTDEHAGVPEGTNCLLEDDKSTVGLHSDVLGIGSATTSDKLEEAGECCECLAILRDQQTEKRMLVTVALGEKGSERALIDTGANVSLIHSDLIDEHSLQLRPSECSFISGFGTGNVIAVRGCCNVGLTFLGVQMKPMQFLVIDAQELRKYRVILATDFLAANQLNVDVTNRRITHTAADGGILEHCCGSGTRVCLTLFRNIPCYAVSSVVVPSGHAEEIPVQWYAPDLGFQDQRDPSPLLCFEESDLWTPYEIPSGLVSAAAQRCKLVVTNNTAEWCKIRSGDLVGTLSSIFPVDRLALSGEVSVSTVTQTSTDPPEIELDCNLGDSKRDIVLRLLKDEEAVFSRGDDDIGTLRGSTHQIILYDYRPIYQRPRRFPEVVNAEVEKQCQELFEADIIEPSNSPWSSPVVPVRKKDGSLRLCIDYRRLNAVTVPDKHPLPNLSDAVFGLYGMRYFTSLDMVRGYYQFGLDESSREFTAFSTHRAHWQFKCLTFGLKNAPSVFQREMQKVLGDFPWENVVVYIDDVLIMSKTFAEHVDLVRRVLRKLAEHGAKIKGQKCRWFCRQVEFLGHIVSEKGLSKPQSYIDAVTNFPRPTTVRELREFIGLINFQRKFVPKCSVIMKPLSRLTGQAKTAKLTWTEEMAEAFERLRDEIQKDIVLAFPDYSESASPLELYTDASGTGVGACLFQRQGDASRHIAYASLAFSAAEKNYSTLDRELAAIRWAVRTFRGFLFGVDFVIRTDHRPLVYLHNMQIVNSRLARTIEDLADYSFVIKYAPGKLNTAADILSRRDWSSVAEEVASEEMTSLPAGLILLETVPGGGDSMVVSLHIVCRQMDLKVKPPASASELRRLLVAELQRAPESYHLIQARTLRRELELMKHDGQLLCVEALEAFAHLFSCIVLVHYGPSFPIVYSSPFCEWKDTHSRVHLQCLCGIHYNPAVELSGYIVPRLMRSAQEVESRPVSETITGVVDEPAAEMNIAGIFSAPTSEWCSRHSRTHAASLMIKCKGLLWFALLELTAYLSVSVLNWE